MVQVNLVEKDEIETETVCGKITMKMNKVALQLVTELTSIRDELGSALNRIEGSGKADVVHAHSRLVDLSSNVTLLVGQFNLKNLLKFLKRSGKLG